MSTPAFIPGAPPAEGDLTAARTQDKHLITPPGAQYVRVDDKLIIDVMNRASASLLVVSYRLMSLDGQIIEFTNNVKISGVFVAQTVTINLNEGYLLGVTIQAGSNIVAPRGSLYVVVSIGRQTGSGVFLRTQAIIAGYATQNAMLAWPGGNLQQPTDGAGWVLAEPVAQPVAGADWSYAQPGNTRARIRAIFARLVTSATVANRQPELVITLLTGAIRLFPVTPLTANAGWNVTWAASFPAWSAQSIDVQAPLPPDLVIPSGVTVATVTAAIQAGDQWSNIGILTEEWIDI